MKPLRMVVPPRLRPYLQILVKGGLSGSTERQVAIRLIEEKLRDQLAMIRAAKSRGYSWPR